MAHLANFCYKFKFKVSKYAFFMNAISFFKSLMHLEAIQSQKNQILGLFLKIQFFLNFPKNTSLRMLQKLSAWIFYSF